MAKYVDNAWHALKVTFANEIGSLAKAQGLDGQRVMDILCTDTKLNLSPVYLRPGFAFGGSCLPKDVRALRYQGRGLDLDLPLLNAILPSNAQQLDRAFQLVTDAGARQVGVLGLAFKAGTDDLRESPMVEVVERLIGKGYEVRIYDANVNLAKLVGANKSYILDQIPHISDLMVSSIDEVLDHARTLVIGNNDPAFRAVAERPRPGSGSSTSSASSTDAAMGMATMASAGRPRRVLIVVQNLPVPFDRRVWLEATTLARAGYQVSVICPKAKGFNRSFEVLEDVHIYRYALPVDAQGALGFVAEFLWCFVRTAMKSVRVAVAGRGFDVLHVCNPPETYWPLGRFWKLFGKRFLFDHHDLSPEMYQAKFGSSGGLAAGRAAVPGAQDVRDGRPGDHHQPEPPADRDRAGRDGAGRRLRGALRPRPRAPDRLPTRPGLAQGQAPPGRLPG